MVQAQQNQGIHGIFTAATARISERSIVRLNKIVLTKIDPKSRGQHQIIPLDWVEKTKCV